jgi:sec-independent protein translocase protein TatA
MFRNPTTDLIIVLVVVLLIFGPKRVPGLGRSLGQGMREFKDSIGGRHGDDEADERPEIAAASTAAAPPAPAAGTTTPEPAPAAARKPEAAPAAAPTPDPSPGEAQSERASAEIGSSESRS